MIQLIWRHLETMNRWKVDFATPPYRVQWVLPSMPGSMYLGMAKNYVQHPPKIETYFTIVQVELFF